jgi:hypothetical protein
MSSCSHNQALRVDVSNLMVSPGNIGEPDTLHRPGYFAVIIFCMMLPPDNMLAHCPGVAVLLLWYRIGPQLGFDAAP